MLCYAEIIAKPCEDKVEDVRILAEALMPDDAEWCKCSFFETMIIKIESHRVESVLSACEDYFRNLKAGIDTLLSIKK